MVINLLVGSGIHWGFLSNVSSLTQEILMLKDNEDDELYQSNKRTKIRSEFRKLINLVFNKIKIYFDGYYITPTYEDIVYILTQIIEDTEGNKYNPIIDDFRNNLFKEYGFSNDKLSTDKIFGEIRYLFKLQELDIFSEINRIIKKSLDIKQYSIKDLSCNLNLLQEISSLNKIDKINVFSLNHDLAFEKFFKEKNINFSDGFNKSSEYLLEFRSWIKAHKFNVNNFDNDCLINLIKLHGSLDWYEASKENLLKNFIYKQNIESRGLDDEEYNSCLIGIYNKTEKYSYYIYMQLFLYFQISLMKSSLLICSGYGFQDKGINNYILDWLNSNINNKIIIIHPNKDELINKERRETFIRKIYTTLENEERLIFIEEKFSNVHLEYEIKQNTTLNKLIKSLG